MKTTPQTAKTVSFTKNTNKKSHYLKKILTDVHSIAPRHRGWASPNPDNNTRTKQYNYKSNHFPTLNTQNCKSTLNDNEPVFNNITYQNSVINPQPRPPYPNFNDFANIIIYY